MKPQAQLIHMPKLVQQKIYSYTDFRSRVSLRKVSRVTRSYVENIEIRMKLILFCISKDHLEIEFNQSCTTNTPMKFSVKYREHPEEGCLISRNENGVDKPSIVIKGGNFVQIALSDLFLALGNNKLIMDNFFFKIDSKSPLVSCIPAIKTFLTSLNGPIQTELHKVFFQENLPQAMIFLPHLMPGELKRICLFALDSSTPTKTVFMNDSLQLEQFFKAQTVFAGEFRFEGPLKPLIAIPRAVIGVNVLDGRMVKYLIQTFVESETSSYCVIHYSRFYVDEFDRQMTEWKLIEKQVMRDSPFMRRIYKVPSVTRFVLEITGHSGYIDLEKIYI